MTASSKPSKPSKPPAPPAPLPMSKRDRLATQLAWGGIGAVLGSIADLFAVLKLDVGFPPVVAVLGIVGGLVAIVVGVTKASKTEVNFIPVTPPPPATPRPLPRHLEIIRRVTLVIAAGCVVIAATAFRVALFDGEQFAAKGISAWVTGVVAATLFARAYWVGTAMRPMPKDADAWDRVMAWFEDHGAIPTLVVLATVVGVMFANIFLGETIGDDLTFHMAESRRLADCIAAGDWDFWNPSANGGYASAYYYQVIPQLASALPAALFGNHLFWFQLSLWLPQVAIPIAGYIGMRNLGASKWQSVIAAFALAFISGESRWGASADGTFDVGLYTQTWALAAFPLGLGYGVRYLTRGEKLPAAVGWGAFVFLCHPFASIALCLGLTVGVIAHYLRYPIRTPRLQLALLAVLGLLFAIVVFKLLSDRPLPPDDNPKAEVDVFKWIYFAPLVLLVGLLARVAANGRTLAYILIGAIAIAVVINVGEFLLVKVVPKRPEGATEDLPAEWTWSAASAYVGPILIMLGVIGRLVLSVVYPPSEDTERPDRKPLVRLVVIGACLLVATLPGWITVIVDRDGFGGFPHRVWDEVGPGYKELSRWYSKGLLLDNERIAILTWCMIPVLAFAQFKLARWLWAPALVFAALLALGPHAPKTADDLLPAVRFLGAMQVMLALAIGAGMFSIGRTIWYASSNSFAGTLGRLLAGRRPYEEILYGLRTIVIALGCALAIFVGLMGGKVLSEKVATLPQYDYRDQMFEMIEIVRRQPQGKKQVGPGCESHWWNQLSYVYARRPALLQMGGGGLQASPNYDFVYSVREFPKLAWVYDTPLFLYAKASGGAPDGEVLGATKDYELRRLAAPGPVTPIEITGVLPEGQSRAGSKVRIAAIDWLKTNDPMANRHLAYWGHNYGPHELVAAWWGAALEFDERVAFLESMSKDAFIGPLTEERSHAELAHRMVNDLSVGPPPDATVTRAFHVDPSPGETADIYAEVEARAPTTFVARESWHPRWHAYVDGVEVPIRRVTPDFPAIDVPAGTHVLAFRFERPWWAHAAWLAWPGATLGAWLVLRRRRKRAS